MNSCKIDSKRKKKNLNLIRKKSTNKREGNKQIILPFNQQNTEISSAPLAMHLHFISINFYFIKGNFNSVSTFHSF